MSRWVWLTSGLPDVLSLYMLMIFYIHLVPIIIHCNIFACFQVQQCRHWKGTPTDSQRKPPYAQVMTSGNWKNHWEPSSISDCFSAGTWKYRWIVHFLKINKLITKCFLKFYIGDDSCLVVLEMSDLCHG